ncbi:replication-relaxation family protein [Actinocatenispora rupis]|uniref:replication-relaxation family protein n=1 Tax=Actinocatenispora rupis TaxID=519421 RepID=UPI0019413F84|nr:replication-relaxation family protein [Actinocatenispora rupis]
MIGSVTDRDRVLLNLLSEHGTLTTAQITTMLFGSPSTAKQRLARLRALLLLDAFRPHNPATGTRGVNHWTLGVLGARLVAAADDRDMPAPSTVARRRDRLAASPRLAHLVGVNQFFADLTGHARHTPETGRLSRWWSEPRTRRAFAERIRPDGHGVWTGPAGPVGFFLEHDTGTERPLARLIAKLDGYQRLADAGGPSWPVLFWLPNATREQHLHDRLATTSIGRDVIVATAHRHCNRPTATHHPAEAMWQVHGGPDARLPIGELPHTADLIGPLNPGLA